VGRLTCDTVSMADFPSRWDTCMHGTWEQCKLDASYALVKRVVLLENKPMDGDDRMVAANSRLVLPGRPGAWLA
jgi:hypothetical protein